MACLWDRQWWVNGMFMGQAMVGEWHVYGTGAVG